MAYGAKADDSHDDTDAFNKAIADAGPNGIVYVPAGTYKILGQIELNGGSGVNWPARLIGPGTKLSVLAHHICCSWPFKLLEPYRPPVERAYLT